MSLFFFFFSSRRRHTRSVSAFLLNRSSDLKCDSYLNQSLTNVPSILSHFSSSNASVRSEERFSRNAETDLVCRLLLEKKKHKDSTENLGCSSTLPASIETISATTGTVTTSYIAST